uniref:Uncharacterized protein n=1 Tax=Aegilops tauschii subsp. strangulata TaxID=200361 RepID=A0A453F6C2_AEGTS
WFLAIYSPSPDAAVAAAAAADWTPQAARSAGEEPDLSPPPLPSVPATSLRAPLTLKGLNMAGLLLRRFIGIQPRAPMTAAGGAALFYASCPSSPRTVAHLEVRGEQAAAEAELSKKSCIPCNSKDLHAMSEDSAKKSLEQVSFSYFVIVKNLIKTSAIPLIDPLKTGDWLGTEK